MSTTNFIFAKYDWMGSIAKTPRDGSTLLGLLSLPRGLEERVQAHFRHGHKELELVPHPSRLMGDASGGSTSRKKRPFFFASVFL